MGHKLIRAGGEIRLYGSRRDAAFHHHDISNFITPWYNHVLRRRATLHQHLRALKNHSLPPSPMLSIVSHRSSQYLRPVSIRSPPYQSHIIFLPTCRFTTSLPRFNKIIDPQLLEEAQKRVNPPISTQPPPLILPPREKKRSFSGLLALGFAYLKFYKTGFKSIYQNWKLTRAIFSRIAPELNPTHALLLNKLTRAEYLLIRRTAQDIRKVIPFGLLFMICGEFTPLAVLVFRGLVPRTLWIPKQLEMARKKNEERRDRAKKEFAIRSKEFEASPDEPNSHNYMGAILGCYPHWWDKLPIPATYFIGRRLEARSLENLLDNYALVRDGGPDAIEGEEELRRALETRGEDVLGKSEDEMRDRLAETLRDFASEWKSQEELQFSLARRLGIGEKVK